MQNQWNDKKVMAKIDDLFADRLEVATAYLSRITKINIAGHGDPDLRAVDQGQHIGSVFHEVSEDGKSGKSGYDGSAEHSEWVEFGTENLDGSVRMPARPSLQRAYDDNKDTILKLLQVQ